MSEKFYALLLRLYPSRFRANYGDEALQLFRDRMEDERGFAAKLRLWFDLVCDLTISIPREYLRPASPRAVAGASAVYPGLHVIEDEPVRFTALLSGSVLSLIAISTMYVSLTHAQTYIPKNLPRYGTEGSKPGTTAPRGKAASESTEGAASSSTATSPRTENPGAVRSAIAKAGKLDDAERRRVIAAASIVLRNHYVNRDAAQMIADSLLTHERRGDYDNLTDPDVFAGRVTQQMREISDDQRLSLDYFDQPLLEQTATSTPESIARYKALMKQQNCTIEKAEILPGNIGYLKLNSFPDMSVCGAKAVSAMQSLNHTGAVIFDLRDNRGGEPATVQKIGAYLFDHPEYWYNPRENTTERSWTQSPVQGNLLANKPVYILTSSQTFSGAEQFCYDLKMLKRATLIGETTAGASHAGVFHRIDDHFGMGIPETKAINPYSQNDWTGVGVTPDIQVKAADALDTAQKLAQAKLLGNNTAAAKR